MEDEVIVFSEKNGFLKVLSKENGLLVFKFNSDFSSSLRLFCNSIVF